MNLGQVLIGGVTLVILILCFSYFRIMRENKRLKTLYEALRWQYQNEVNRYYEPVKPLSAEQVHRLMAGESYASVTKLDPKDQSAILAEMEARDDRH